jgi:hypothetical protein
MPVDDTDILSLFMNAPYHHVELGVEFGGRQKYARLALLFSGFFACFSRTF